MSARSKAFKYSVAVASVMLVMSSVLVISGMLNDKLHDTAKTFKSTCSESKCWKLLGIKPDDIGMFNNSAVAMGALAAGIYSMALATMKGKNSPSDLVHTSATSPGVYSAIVAFMVAFVLIASGVVMLELPKQIEEYNDDKQQKTAKAIQHTGPAVIALGASIPAFYIARFVMDNKAKFRPTRVIPQVSGGWKDTMSTFFTY